MPALRIDIPEPLQELADAGEVPGSGAAPADPATRYKARTRRVLTRGGAMRGHVNLFLSDSGIRAADGLDAPLRDGDVLMAVAPVTGG